MYFDGPIYSYAQLAAEAERYYESLPDRDELLENAEPFYDDYNEVIEDGECYLDIDTGLFSKISLEKLLKEYKESGKDVWEYLKSIYGEDFEYPAEKGNAEYCIECYEMEDIDNLFDYLSWREYQVYNIKNHI